MRCLYWDGDRVRLSDRPLPEVPDGYALVRVSLAGVCATDLEITRGYMDFRGILGHEFVGRVEDGPKDWIDSWKDQRVVGEINFACGSCPTCHRGLERHCPGRRVLGILDADGVFSQYACLPTANLHRVPDGVPDDAAVFTEPLAAAYEILDQVPIDAAKRCLVFGDGRLGLLCAQVLQAAGGRVLVIGKHPDKLAHLARRGIETRLLRDWQESEAPERADVVVEATGTSDGFTRAMSATRPRGTLVLKSTVADAPSLNLAPLVIDEIQVVGSRCGAFQPALEALAEGRVDVETMIAERLPLERGVDALTRAAQSGVLKVLIDCR